MWTWYLQLGLRSLRRNPLLTLLMIAILGFGIGTSMTAYTVVHVLGGDPIPHKSKRLFVPQLDPGEKEGYTEGDEPDLQLGWLDTEVLLRDAKGSNRSATYGVSPIVDTGLETLKPDVWPGLATTRGFFEMFDVPFRSGGPWNEAEDESGGFVAVIGPELAERAFGKESAIGKIIKLDDRDYRIVGVLDVWRPFPRYYRLLSGTNTGEYEQVYVPFRNGLLREWGNDGWTNCTGSSPPDLIGFAGFLKRECMWIQYWVQYKSYLAAHIAAQRKLGRFPRPDNFRLRDVREWLAINQVVDAESRTQGLIAFGFLLVCIVNVVGLLLAKFSARAGEFSVRRALGASRAEILKQALAEVAVIGAAGAALGIALAWLGLKVVDEYSFNGAKFATLDLQLLAITVALALVSAILAGLLPGIKAAMQVPAMQLKAQ
jgi:putative ABC transport system permease protein